MTLLLECDKLPLFWSEVHTAGKGAGCTYRKIMYGAWKMQNILVTASYWFGPLKLFTLCRKSILILLISFEILKEISWGLRCTVPINLNWNYQHLNALNALGNPSFIFYCRTLFSAVNLQSRQPWVQWAASIVIVWVPAVSWLDSGFRSLCVVHDEGAACAVKDYPGRSVILTDQKSRTLEKLKKQLLLDHGEPAVQVDGAPELMLFI